MTKKNLYIAIDKAKVFAGVAEEILNPHTGLTLRSDRNWTEHHRQRALSYAQDLIRSLENLNEPEAEAHDCPACTDSPKPTNP